MVRRGREEGGLGVRERKQFGVMCSTTLGDASYKISLSHKHTRTHTKRTHTQMVVVLFFWLVWWTAATLPSNQECVCVCLCAWLFIKESSRSIGRASPRLFKLTRSSHTIPLPGLMPKIPLSWKLGVGAEEGSVNSPPLG